MEYNIFKEQKYIARMSPSYWNQINYIRKGCRWIDENSSRFDVMHSVSTYHYSILPSFKAEKSGLPSVIFVTNSLQLQDKSKFRARILGLTRKRRELIKHLSCLIAMSQDIYEELLSYGVSEDRIARIPMGVNTGIFAPLENDVEKQRLKLQMGLKDSRSVLFVGEYIRRKQPHLLIEAIGLLKKRRMELQLMLVGPASDLEYTNAMKQRAKDLGIEDQVHWIGYTREVASYYKVADIFCLPSSNEGMSAALVESMASGLAPVVTPVSGSADLVDHGVNGFIIKPSEVDIANTLAEYAKDSSLIELHADRSLKLIHEKFSREVVYSSYEKLFRRIMAGLPAAE